MPIIKIHLLNLSFNNNKQECCVFAFNFQIEKAISPQNQFFLKI